MASSSIVIVECPPTMKRGTDGARSAESRIEVDSFESAANALLYVCAECAVSFLRTVLFAICVSIFLLSQAIGGVVHGIVTSVWLLGQVARAFPMLLLAAVVIPVALAGMIMLGLSELWDAFLAWKGRMTASLSASIAGTHGGETARKRVLKLSIPAPLSRPHPVLVLGKPLEDPSVTASSSIQNSPIMGESPITPIEDVHTVLATRDSGGGTGPEPYWASQHISASKMGQETFIALRALMKGGKPDGEDAGSGQEQPNVEHLKAVLELDICAEEMRSYEALEVVEQTVM